MQFINRSLRGGIDISEPVVDAVWSDQPELAYARRIRYYPDPPGGYFKIGSVETMPLAGTQDDREHANKIVESLENAGFEAYWAPHPSSPVSRD
jgi:hypothetical protein